MKFIDLRFVVSVLALLLAYPVHASSVVLKNGTDYILVGAPNKPSRSGKVEVVEFFLYTCPHCRAFEAPLKQWSAKKGADVELVRIPGNFSETSGLQQQLYYALKKLGLQDKLQSAAFNVGQQKGALDTKENILSFIAAQGVDKTAFLAAFDSASVHEEVLRARALQAAYQVKGVPVLVIDQTYLTSPGFFHPNLSVMTQLMDMVRLSAAEIAAREAGEMQRVLQAADALINQIHKENPSVR